MHYFREFQYIMVRNHLVLHLYQESNCEYSTGKGKTAKERRQKKEEGKYKNRNKKNLLKFPYILTISLLLPFGFFWSSGYHSM